MDHDFSQIAHVQLLQSYKSGVRWFYWIAGLSMATSIITFAGGGWRFFISLGITQVIDGFARGLSSESGALNVVALVMDIMVTGIFLGFGLLAARKLLWAYILRMVLFLLDGLVLLLFQDWIGAGFHGLVLFWMFRGFQAGQELCVFEKTMAEQSAQAP